MSRIEGPFLIIIPGKRDKDHVVQVKPVEFKLNDLTKWQLFFKDSFPKFRFAGEWIYGWVYNEEMRKITRFLEGRWESIRKFMSYNLNTQKKLF